MPFDYDPEDASTCWPEGQYEAVLLKTEDGTSKQGNPMLTLTFRVFSPDGNKAQELKEYIVKATTFKLLRFARAIGKEQEFRDKRFNAEDHLNASVLVTLAIDKQTGYDDKNTIDGYAAMTRAPRSAPAKVAAATDPGAFDITDKDIPF